MTTTIDSTAKPTTLLEPSDANLARANVYRLASTAAFHFSPAFALRYTVISTIAYLYSIVMQTKHAYEAIPSSNRTVKSLARPILQQLMPFIGVAYPEIGKIYCVAVLAGIAQNSVPKLLTSLKTIKESPLRSLQCAAIHTFNLASQCFYAKKDYDSFDSMADQWEQFEPFSNSESRNTNYYEKKAKKFTHMSDIERLKTNKLDPTHLGDAHIIMNLKEDTCKAVKSAFRRLSRVAHPDKGGSTAAQTNLNNAYDTLKKSMC